MGEVTIFDEIKAWFLHLPIRLAYRIIWLMAKLGSRNAKDVHDAMWTHAKLNVPPLSREWQTCMERRRP